MYKIIKILLFLIPLSISAKYVDISSPNTYKCIKSIETLIHMSVDTHPSMKAAKQTLAASNSSVDGAEWNYYPSFSLDMSRSSEGLGTTVRLEQPLWAGGRIDAIYEMALAKRDEADFAFSQSAYSLSNTLLEVIQSYLQFKEAIVILKESKKQLEAFQNMIERRIKSGISPETDRSLIKSRIAANNNDLTAAKVSMKTALGKIKLIIGESDFSCDIKFESPIVTDNIDSMIIKMIKTHPALKKADTQIEAAIHAKEKESSALWPTISAVAEHQEGSVYNDSSSSNNSIYLSVKMSPGAGLSAFSNIQAAEAEVQRLRYVKQSITQELTTTLLSDYEAYHMANEQIYEMRTAIDTAQKVLDSYKRLFIAGKRQWLDLVNAVREVTQNRLNFSDSQVRQIVSGYRISIQQGDILSSQKDTK